MDRAQQAISTPQRFSPTRRTDEATFTITPLDVGSQAVRDGVARQLEEERTALLLSCSPARREARPRQDPRRKDRSRRAIRIRARGRNPDRGGIVIPDDLKDYRPGFQLFTSEEAGSLLAVLVAGLIVIDLARRLFGWMFE